MIDPDEWTPALGWRIAMRRSVIRGAVGAGVAGLVVYGLYPVRAALGALLSMVIVVVSSSAVVGVPVGLATCWRLGEKSGLAGRSLLLPVTAVVLAAELAAMLVALELRGGQMDLGMAAVISGVAAWTFGACLVTLLLQ
ncbi:MAG: hypothetical protein ACOC8F_05825 [Planctomycetota bacterium]